MVSLHVSLRGSVGQRLLAYLCGRRRHHRHRGRDSYRTDCCRLHHHTEPSQTDADRSAAWPHEEPTEDHGPAWNLRTAVSRLGQKAGGRGAWSVLTVRSEECDRGSVRAGTASTTNSVDVVLRVVGIVIVEHVSDVAHVFLDRLAVFRERVCIATVQPDPDSESIGTSKLPMVPLRTLLLW